MSDDAAVANSRTAGLARAWWLLGLPLGYLLHLADEWWGGEGAARVFEHDGNALLMERAEGETSLAVFSRTGRDDDACRILCTAVARLHTSRPVPSRILVPLRR